MPDALPHPAGFPAAAPRLPSWLLILPVVLAALAVMAMRWWDQPLIGDFGSGGVWHDRAFRVLLPCLALIVIMTLVTVALHAATWRRRGVGLATLFGGVCALGGLAAYGRATAPTGVAALLLGLAGGAVAWGTLVAILAQLANRRRLLAGLALTLLCSTALTHLVKWLVGRARPFTHLGLWHLQPGDGRGAFESFPSGHCGAAAAVAAFLTLVCPRGTPIFIVYAFAIGFERVVADKHFPSDVLAGWAVGLVGAALARRLLGPSCFTRRPQPTVATAPASADVFRQDRSAVA
jgi:membrane-associated phospholipid phosphatase